MHTLIVHPPCIRTNPQRYWVNDIWLYLLCRAIDIVCIKFRNGFPSELRGTSDSIDETILNVFGALSVSSWWNLSQVKDRISWWARACKTEFEFLKQSSLHSSATTEAAPEDTSSGLCFLIISTIDLSTFFPHIIALQTFLCASFVINWDFLPLL